MKNLLKIILFLLILVGIILGVFYGFKDNKNVEDKIINNIFSKVQVQEAAITKFYTYGNSFNLECSLSRS